MTREGALANLLQEARFYALDMLVAKIEQFHNDASMKTVNQLTSVRKYMLATVGLFTHDWKSN